jgi:hypothetical protein
MAGRPRKARFDAAAGGAELISVVNIPHSHLRRHGDQAIKTPQYIVKRNWPAGELQKSKMWKGRSTRAQGRGSDIVMPAIAGRMASQNAIRQIKLYAC